MVLKIKITFFALLFLLSQLAVIAQDRFPKPDFQHGYKYPTVEYHVPNVTIWATIDIVILLALMSFVAWAIIKRRTRKPIVWVSVISVAYFGFFREGCVCSVGSLQNVALTLSDSSYAMPFLVLVFFMAPIIFAFLFGRVFCAGVCPLGALQELVNIKNFRLSKALTTVLEILPWLYLIFAVLFAVTQSRFIICRYDPFVGIFRMGGDFPLIVFGIVLLITAIFVGRPFCRFICPYGVLLGLFARVSIWNIKLTEKTCINCELCHNACPVDAIKPPYDSKIKETRAEGVKRILLYFAVLPVMVIFTAALMRYSSDTLSKMHRDVSLLEMVIEHEANPVFELSLDLEGFYERGRTVEELTEKVDAIKAEYKFYSTVAGGFIGLVIGFSLIGFSLKRTRKLYEIDHAQCVDCGRCFNYCPQNKIDT
jgi:polyferredoxin